MSDAKSFSLRDRSMWMQGVCASLSAAGYKVTAIAWRADCQIDVETAEGLTVTLPGTPAVTGSPPAPEALVYVIAMEQSPRVKIGIAVDVKVRLRGLQTACPERLVLLATAPGGQELERRLHAEFKEYRLSGEWFERGPWVDGLIARLGAAP